MNENSPGKPGRTQSTIHYDQRFRVAYRYPVIFTPHLFDPGNPCLADTLRRTGTAVPPARVRVYTDAGLVRADPGLTGRIRAYAAVHRDGVEWIGRPVQWPGGESAKNGWRVCHRVIADLAAHHLCRHSFVLAVGGGAFLDAVGMGAALYHRGVRLLRVPTTVLAQADSGIGVKNGINLHGIKNAAGVFAPPAAVLIDPAFPETLDDENWTGGLSEVFKVALIRDAALFRDLRARAARFRARDGAAMADAIRRCARLHLDHIRGGDPFEQGSARPLDFGHWSAHRIEHLSGYEIGHGMAVAVGIALDTVYARRGGYLTRSACDAVLDALSACGLPSWSRWLRARDARGNPAILAGLDEFREHLGGRLAVTLPSPLGTGIEVHAMDHARIRAAIDELAARAADPDARLGGPA